VYLFKKIIGSKGNNMSTQLNPQEIYLLERYTSLEYFGVLRDTWGEMVSHVDACLTAFMEKLPADYRRRPLPEQPDMVWGERVLPNFRDTFQGLCTGFVLLSHGDVAGLEFAYGPSSDFKGQMDFWAGWMAKPDLNVYSTLLNKSTTMAGNICAAEGAYWKPTDLSNYSEDRGPLDAPPTWPTYRINKEISVRTGERTRQSGIYIPDVDNSCAEFLSIRYQQAPCASVLIRFDDLLHPITGAKYGETPIFEKRDCVWYLVERTADIGSANSGITTHVYRIPAGEACPETGFYVTPANAASRRLFQKGEVMPALETEYGATIWQWDSCV
jgi:hypothetical protein